MKSDCEKLRQIVNCLLEYHWVEVSLMIVSGQLTSHERLDIRMGPADSSIHDFISRL
jgi:hypothetical protein